MTTNSKTRPEINMISGFTFKKPTPTLCRGGLASHKPDSVYAIICLGHRLPSGSMRHSPFLEYDLAPGKDLAVSPPLCYPYHGVRPASLGLGLSDLFKSDRHCSHLYSYERRLLAATLLLPTCRQAGVSGLSSSASSADAIA